MVNDFIKFYGENNISPVNQNIDDINLHYRRRQKLYRQCGIPTIAFKNATMLEVGPGGGHNALAPLHWGIKHIDMVEPNITGVNTIKRLFSDYKIEDDKYTIYNTSIEDYGMDKKYDFIIAEGFLSYVSNAVEICNKLQLLCNVGG